MYNNFAKKSLRYVINYFFSEYLHKSIEDGQIDSDEKFFILKDIYFNIQKLNAIFEEKNLPLAVSVAFIGRLSLCTTNIEVDDLELVVQTTSLNIVHHGGGMVNSLISSVTALAFAAVTCASETECSEPASSSASESSYWANLVQKVEGFVSHFSGKNFEDSLPFNDTNMDQAVQTLEKIVLGASLTIRNVKIRLQCPLQVERFPRVCDLRLQIKVMEMNKVQRPFATPESTSSTLVSPKTTHGPTASTSEEGRVPSTSGGQWSWMWPSSWFSYLAGRIPLKSSVADPCIRLLFRFEGLSLHLDLWDTKTKNQITSPPSADEADCPSDTNWEDSSQHVSDHGTNLYSGPDRDSMLASGCLLNLPDKANYLTMQLFFNSDFFDSNSGDSPSQDQIQANVTFDLGPVVACFSPSQVFWLSSILTQLTKLVESYISSNTMSSSDSAISSSAKSVVISSETASEKRTDAPTENGGSVSPSKSLIGSNMFRSCMSASDFPQSNVYDAAMQFSVSLRCRLLSLTFFHADEAASLSPSRRPPLTARGCSLSSSADSLADSEEQYHSFRSAEEEAATTQVVPSLPNGTLRTHHAFFTAIEGNEEGVLDLMVAGKRSSSASQWLAQLDSKMATITSARDHLRLTLGDCELDVGFEKSDAAFFEGEVFVDAPEVAETEVGIRAKGSLVGHVDGVLLTECLFDSNSAPQITKVLSFAEPSDALLPSLRLAGATENSWRLQLASCHLDLDPGLSDRVHRTLDALASACRVAPIVSHNVDLATYIGDMGGLGSKEDCCRIHRWLEQHHAGSDEAYQSSQPLCDVCQGSASLLSRLPAIEVTCPSIRATIRIPIPLASMPMLPGEDFSQMRERLCTGVGAHLSEAALPWWRPCVRSESLEVLFESTSFSLATADSHSSDWMWHFRFQRHLAYFSQGHRALRPFFVVSSRSSTTSASIFARIPGNNREAEAPSGASKGSAELSGSEDALEGSLLSNLKSKSDVRNPFVKDAVFISRSANGSSEVESLSPGRAEHLSAYRRAATQGADCCVSISLPAVQFNVFSDHSLQLLNNRLLMDLALWQSRLPPSLQARSLLAVGGGIQSFPNSRDHRVWLLSESTDTCDDKESSSGGSVSRRNSSHERGNPHDDSLGSSSDFDATGDSTVLSLEAKARGGNKTANRISTPPEAPTSTSIFIKLDIDSLCARAGMKPLANPRSVSSTAALHVRSIQLTTEISPQKQTNLMYTTLNCDNIRVFDMENFTPNLESGGDEDKGNLPKIDFPILLPMNVDLGNTPEPALSVVLKKHSIQSQVSPEALISPNEEITVALTLRGVCVCNWPNLQWQVERLPQLPKDSLAFEYPSLVYPAYSYVLHGHFENCAFTSPSVNAFHSVPTSEGVHEAEVPPGLDCLRPLVVAEKLVTYGEFGSRTRLTTFLETCSLQLVPPINIGSAMRLWSSTMRTHESLISAFLKEKKFLNDLVNEPFRSIVRRSVRVSIVDHMRLTILLDSPEPTRPQVTEILIADISFSVNVCMDSLVAIKLLLENMTCNSATPRLKKASSVPIVSHTYPEEGEDCTVRGIVGLLSNAIEDDDPTLRPPTPQFSHDEEDDFFVVKASEMSSTSCSRKPVTCLRDGAWVYETSDWEFRRDFYPPVRKCGPGTKRASLDPMGSTSLFSFTIEDSFVQFTLFGGLDFPSLNCNIDVDDLIKQTAAVSDGFECFPRGRQADRKVTLSLSKIFFRKSTFEPPPNYPVLVNRGFGIPGRSVSCSSLSTRINSPVTRYALRVHDVTIKDGLSDSHMNYLFHAQKSRCSIEDGNFSDTFRGSAIVWPSFSSTEVPAAISPDYESVAKVSIQPLEINLDQAMFDFIRVYQGIFNKLAEQYASELGRRLSLLPVLSEFPEGSAGFPPNQGAKPDDCDYDSDSPLFIRRLLFYPALPVRFNYNGHRLNMEQGALVGLAALLLRLRNADLDLPRHTYKRGYKGVASLLNAITEHWTATLQANIVPILATSIGPMHEVSCILAGVRDCVRHVVKALNSPFRRGPRGQRRMFSRAAAEEVVFGLRNGVQALSTKSLWPVLELSSQGIHAAQFFFETVFDILSPGPAIRTRHLSHPQLSSTWSSRGDRWAAAASGQAEPPGDLREGVCKAVQSIQQGTRQLVADFTAPLSETDNEKGPVGAIGAVLRQIPPTVVLPMVLTCEVGSNIVDGMRNQIRPNVKKEDKEKWKRGRSG